MSICSFKLSAVAVCISLLYCSGAQADAILKGHMTINGEASSFERGPDVSVGSAGDEIVITKYSADSLFVHEAKLVVDGASIDVEGYSSAVYSQENSRVNIGSVNTQSVRLGGVNFGVYSRSGSVMTVDAADTITLTSVSGSDCDFAAAMALGGDLVIGASSKTISVLAESDNKYQKHSSTGLKVLDGGNITVGSGATNSLLISSKHKTNATAISGQSQNSAQGGSITLVGQNIQATAVSEDQAFGVNVLHSVDATIGNDNSQFVHLTVNSTGTNISSLSRAIGIQAASQYDDFSEVSVNGQQIAIDSSAHMEAIGVYAGTNSVLRIGNDATESINIRAMNTQQNAESFAFGVWVDNSADWKKNGGKVELKGKKVSIYAEGGTDIRGIHVATNDLNPAGSHAELDIKADDIRIEANSTNEDVESIGISAMSAGKVNVIGNTFISADAAILARGEASVSINVDKNYTTQIEGNIDFNFDKESSGTKVDSTVLLNLTGPDSYWTGAAIKSYNGQASDALMEVTGLKLRFADGASWNATVAEESSGTESGTIGIAINELTLDGGNINATKAGQQVKVQKLKIDEGGGTFNAPTIEKADGSLSSAQLDVKSIDSSDAGSTAPRMTVNYTGINADDLTKENISDLNPFVDQNVTKSLNLVETVAEGDINGQWIRSTTADGKSTISQESNTKLESFKGVNAASLVQWRNQVNHLTKRLGDVRLQQGDAGAWARVYGGEYKWGDANHVDMTSTTVQAGGDARVGDWIVGGAFSYSDSSFDLENGDGDGDLYTIALYGSRMFEKGSYIDFVARYGYIKSDFKAGNMDVSFDSNAFGLSVETGHTFKFMERAYVEPQIEVSYGYAQGDDAMASNGVLLEQDDYQNLITRIGLRTGFDFPENAGTIYAHVSYSYDFLGDADGTASKDGLRTSLSEDLGGGWVTYGIGGQLRLGQSTFAYGELERSTGGDVENPWAFNIGVRHLF